jgi:hypothetical protein
MNKFTPGPWNQGDGSISSQRLVYGGKYNVLIASTENNSVSLSKGKANARLIAAAPDLLEALEEIMDGYLYGCDMETKRENIAKARAAIARAKGEQN